MAKKQVPKEFLKKRAFSRKAALIVMDLLTNYMRDNPVNEACNYQINMKSFYYNFTIKEVDLIIIKISTRGEITYRLWDCVGNSSEDYMTYYSYDESSNHQDVLKKFKEDLERMMADFKYLGFLHGFTDTHISYDTNTDIALYPVEKLITEEQK